MQELGIDYELCKVDLKTKKLDDGSDFTKIAKKGVVPMLELDNGEQLTEGAAMVQYLADLKPELNLAPKNGSFERVRVQEWLNYIATEVHKTHWPLFFKDKVGEQASETYLGKLKDAYTYVSEALGEQDYLMGEQFSIADAYMFTVINWHNFLNIDLSPWPTLVAYQKRVAARPAVKAAMEAEGILEEKAA